MYLSGRLIFLSKLEKNIKIVSFNIFGNTLEGVKFKKIVLSSEIIQIEERSSELTILD